MFHLQKISNYGTSTPAVARTLPQGSDLLGFFMVPDEQKEQCKTVLMELQRHLVRCVEIQDRIGTEVEKGRTSIEQNGFQFQSAGRVVTLPGVADLQSQAEAFLQSAKLAIRETAQLVEPFFGSKLDHRFHKFASWAETQFGKEDKFTHLIRQWEPWVKHIVTMRNAVDHPNVNPGGKLVTQNFRLNGTSDEPRLVEPSWGLSGGPECPMLSDMEAIIEGTIQLGEEILVGLFYKFIGDIPIVVYEIPKDERDPAFPKRLRVGLSSKSPYA